MTSTAITTQAIAKRATVKQEAATAALVEHFSDTVKLEISDNGNLHIDKTKMQAVKRFQKDTLKNFLAIATPLTIFTSGFFATIACYDITSSNGAVFLSLASITGIATIGSAAKLGFSAGARARKRIDFIAKNSEPEIKDFLLERGITVDPGTLTDIAQTIVHIVTGEDRQPTAKNYNTIDGHEFRIRKTNSNIIVEHVEKAAPSTKQKVVELATQLSSDMAVINQIRNKTLQLSTQQLSAEKAYTFSKAQKDAQKAIKLAQELQQLGDSNWEKALNASLQPINIELETLIEECRNEKRQQLTSIRS